MNVGIVGASGFAGGELLRLLLQHPDVEVTGATSRQYDGQPLHRAHPNLRGASELRFTTELADVDTVFTCMPHGKSGSIIATHLEAGRKVIDLSADYRLKDAATYKAWYDLDHPHPELLEQAVYGLPEKHRDAIKGASLVSGVGCVATSMNLALHPLAQAGLLDNARVVVDAKIGSSAAGASANPSTAHPARSRSLRLYAPTNHRHAAEVAQESGITPEVSVHTAELVRGVLATCHVLYEDEAPDEKALWRVWRPATKDEPFLRVVKERQGVHRGPDPKLVAGSNFVDMGFHSEGRRIVATCALDNLVKGAAGSAVQSMNLMHGNDETTALMQLPVHPQ